MKPFQRGYADDPEAVEVALVRATAALVAAGAAGDDAARLELLGRVGEMERMLGRLDDAIAHLRTARTLARERGDARREITALIRLATALQYHEEHAEADALFRECLAAIARTGERGHEDFAHQHYGKCLVEQGRTVEAVAHFEHALALRQARGDAGLIASTRAALAAVSGQWECRDAH